MKNDKIVNAFDSIQPSETVKNRVFDKVMQRQQKQRPVFKVAVSLTTAAAMICLIVFGSMLLTPQEANVFALKAYAMEVQDDGSVIYTALLSSDPNRQDFDITSQRAEIVRTGTGLAWGGFHDGKNLLMSVNLKAEGENIKHVDFYIDDGFFAKQYLQFDANGKLITDNIPILYIGESNAIGSYGLEYEIIGGKLTLSKDSFTDDLLIFLGREDTNWGERIDLLAVPFTVRAVATFNDGKTQEETLVFNFKEMGKETGGIGMIVRHFSDEELLQMTYDATDMDKMELAFINEAQNQNIGEVRVSNIDVHNFVRPTWAGYWMITFDLLPEGSTEWLLNQTQVVQQMSTDPVTRDIVVRFIHE